MDADARAVGHSSNTYGVAAQADNHLSPLDQLMPGQPELRRGESAFAGERRTAVTDELATLLAGSDVIVAGPWISEVGFEVLYWIPFLRWAQERFALHPSRVVVVSRGGTQSWYAGLCSRYVDIFDHFSAEEFRRMSEARWTEIGGQKQSAIGSWDELVLQRVGPAIKHRYRLLHPGTMYVDFREYWLARAPIEAVAEHTRYVRFTPPSGILDKRRLPDEDFIAIKFYFRPSFPDTQENREFASGVVRTLAEKMPVVLLNTGVAFDDHEEYDPGRGRGVHRVVSETAADNLALQTEIIGQAAALVGTYGGLTYLGSALGVPTVGFWSVPNAVKPEHVRVGWLAAEALGTPLVALDVGDTEVLSLLAPTPGER